MEIYEKVIKFVDTNLIYCLIPMILTLILIEILFKNKLPTKKVLQIISWTIIVYTLITIVYFVFGFILFADEFTFTSRANGPYKTIYWLMFLSATILPLTLLIKKLSSIFWYVLLVAFLMKIGVFFEQFVILTTSKNYPSGNQTSDSLNLWAYGVLMLVLQGLVIVTLILGILKIIEPSKTRPLSS